MSLAFCFVIHFYFIEAQMTFSYFPHTFRLAFMLSLVLWSHLLFIIYELFIHQEVTTFRTSQCLLSKPCHIILQILSLEDDLDRGQRRCNFSVTHAPVNRDSFALQLQNAMSHALTERKRVFTSQHIVWLNCLICAF